MKKFFLLLSLMTITIVAIAQESVAVQDLNDNNEESVYALALNAPVVSERQMTGFAQSNRAVKEYDKYQKVAIAGWALFSAGIVSMAVGIPMWVEGAQSVREDATDTSENASFFNLFGSGALYGAGVYVTCTGAAMTSAGIICLGVGYGKRGGNADLTYYGTQCRRLPVVKFDLQSSADGVGIAMKF